MHQSLPAHAPSYKHLGFWGIILISGILTYVAFSFYSLRNVIVSKDEVAFDHSQKLLDAETLSLKAEKKVASSRGFLLFGEIEMLRKMDEAHKEFIHYLEELKKSKLSPQGLALLETVEKAEEEHHQVLLELIQRKALLKEPEKFQDFFTERLVPRRVRLESALEAFENHKRKILDESRKESVSSAARALNYSFFLGVITFITIPLMGFFLYQSLRGQKKALEQAETAADRFYDLVNHLDHSIVWEGEAAPFAFTFVSERAQFLIGVSGKEWEKNTQSFFDRIPADQHAEIKETFLLAKNTLSDQRCVHQMITSENKLIWVQTGVHPKRKAQGEVKFYGLIMDITPLKEAKDKLQTIQQQFQSIMENAPSLIYMKDSQGKYLFCNKQVEKFLNLRADQIVERLDSDILSPDNIEQVHKIDRLVMETGEAIKDEEIFTINHTKTTFLTTKFPLRNIGGEIYGVCGIATDITEQKEALEAYKDSEERLDLALRGSGMGIWDWDVRHHHLIWNDNTYHMFNYPLNYTLQGFSSFEQRIHPEDRELVLKALNDSMENKKDFRAEFRIIWSNGSIRTIMSLGRAIYDNENKPCRVVGVVVDITERKNFEKSLENAVRVREEVLAVVSHDLRNPLGVMLMSAGLVDRKAPDDEFGHWVRIQVAKITKAGERMNNLIEDLLNLAKLEAGHFHLERKSFTVDSLLDDVYETAYLQAREHSVVLTKKNESKGIRVLVDQAQIIRVLHNLVGNALKFTPADGQILMEVRNSKTHVIFTVQDTGPGIADHHLPHVFDRFWQAQGTSHKGTGLGLAISKGIIEAHGGSIWAESRFGQGAKFSFTLPILGS
jgi:PAS domain S-box-containing protein